MKQITAEHCARIHPYLPVQRENVRIPNIIVINAILYVLENGCKWRALPECFGLDSTSVKVHPDGTSAQMKNGPKSIGKSRGGWNTKIRMVSASDRHTMIFRLSGGQARDAPEGRVLLESWDKPVANAPLAMDYAYECDKTRGLVETLGMTPVVPPKANRKVKWDYNKDLYKLRTEVERLFRRLKVYRRIHTRFKRLDVMFPGFLNFTLVVEMICDLA